MIYKILSYLNAIIILLLMFIFKKWVKLIVKKELTVFELRYPKKIETIQKLIKLIEYLEMLRSKNIEVVEIKKEVNDKYKSIKSCINELKMLSLNKKTIHLLKEVFKEKNGESYIKTTSINIERHKQNIEKLEKLLNNEIT